MPNRGRSTIIRRVSAVAIAALALFGGDAAAQSQTEKEHEEKTLKEVVVSSSAESEQKTVTGPAPKSVEEFPGGITVLSENEVEQVVPLSTIDALQQVPGVNVTTEDGRGLRPNIGLRGLDPDRSREGVLILADGVPIQPALYGDRSAYYNVPVELIERIEVIKGSSALYGPSNIGGVVNYITKRPPKKPGQELQLNETFREGSMFDSVVSYGVTGNNGVGALLSYTNRTGETVRDNTGLDLHDFNIRTIVPTDNRGELSLRFNYYREDAETPGGLSPEVFNKNPDLSTRSHDKFYGRRASFDANYVQPLKGDFTIDTLLYTNFFQRDWYLADGADGIATTNSQFIRDFFVAGIEPRLRWKDWVLGTRLHTERLDDVSKRGESPSARTGLTVADNDLSTFAWSTYLQGDIKPLEQFTITPGIRYERVDQTREVGIRQDPELGAVRGESGSALTNEVVGGVQFNFDTRGFGNVYGGVQRTFEPPTFSEAVDPTTGSDNDLDAETAITYELGYRAALNSWLAADATLFLLDFDNKIVTEGGALVNGGETRHEGVEFGLTATPLEQVRANLAVTLLDTEFRSGANEGKEVPMAPDSRLAWGISYLPIEELTLRVDGYFVDEQFTDPANTKAETADGGRGELPSYDVWNVRANYLLPKTFLGDNITLFTGVNNVFNEEYRERRQASMGGIIPGLTRTFYAGLEARF